jgi:hypothetical protein
MKEIQHAEPSLQYITARAHIGQGPTEEAMPKTRTTATATTITKTTMRKSHHRLFGLSNIILRCVS